jgi:hypothetical protein
MRQAVETYTMEDAPKRTLEENIEAWWVDRVRRGLEHYDEVIMPRRFAVSMKQQHRQE